MAEENKLDSWKKYIVAGNRRFGASDYESAQALYEVARRHAEALFPRWKNIDEAASALVVTYHNIADLHQRQGNAYLARRALERVHRIVLYAVASTPVHDQRHPILFKAVNVTYNELLAHKRCHLLNDPI